LPFLRATRRVILLRDYHIFLRYTSPHTFAGGSRCVVWF